MNISCDIRPITHDALPRHLMTLNPPGSPVCFHSAPSCAPASLFPVSSLISTSPFFALPLYDIFPISSLLLPSCFRSAFLLPIYDLLFTSCFLFPPFPSHLVSFLLYFLFPILFFLLKSCPLLFLLFSSCELSPLCFLFPLLFTSCLFPSACSLLVSCSLPIISSPSPLTLLLASHVVLCKLCLKGWWRPVAGGRDSP